MQPSVAMDEPVSKKLLCAERGRQVDGMNKPYKLHSITVRMLVVTRWPLLMQVVVPIWTLALYHAVAYAGSRFGSTRLWQQYGAKLQHILSAYQVCHTSVLSADFELSLQPMQHLILARGSLSIMST